MKQISPRAIVEAILDVSFRVRSSPTIACRKYTLVFFIAIGLSAASRAAPVIDPIADVTIPAGKSLILPVTATSSTGQPLTYSVGSSTNKITVAMHTNNPFWQLSVAQVADSNAPGAYQT